MEASVAGQAGTSATLPGRGVVVRFDGSPESVAAVDWAALEARARRSSLRLAVCRPPLDPLDHHGAGRQIEDAVNAICQRHPDLTIDRRATHLDPDDAVIAHAAVASLLVVGAGSRTAETLLLESIPRASARRSTSPVVVVHGARLPTVRRIVVGVDSSSAARAAIDWAIGEADLHDAEIVVAHAWKRWEAGHSVRAGDVARSEAQNLLELAVNRCRERTGRAVEAVLVTAPAAAALVDASRNADLMVLGSRGSGFKTLLFGSIALFVAEHAVCPVAITHPTPDRA